MLSNQISGTYILYLIFVSLLLYLVFFGYGQIFKKYTAILGSFAGGFIWFLAVNEILALPFMLLHLSYTLYVIMFILLNVPFLIYGGFKFNSRKSSFSLSKHKNPFLYVFLLFLVAGIVFTQIFAYHSADDSFYVSLIEQNKSSSVLYSIDPATGSKKHLFPKAYRFQSLELIESAVSSVTNLTSSETARGLMPLIIVPLTFLIHGSIFNNLLSKKRYIYLALTFLMVFLMFGGYSVRSQGAFFLTRPWQGKTILANLMLPLLIFLLYKLATNKSKQDKKRLLITAFVLNLAALAVNPSSVFLVTAAVSVFGLIMLFIKKPLKDVLWLGITLLPMVPIVLFTILFSSGKGAARLDIRPYADYFLEFVGNPWFLFVLVFGLLVLFRAKEMKKARLLVYIYPAVLLLTILNPLFYRLMSYYVTSTAYWRLFWLVPTTIILPLIGVLFYKFLEKKVSKVFRSFLSFGIICLFMLCGTFVYLKNYEVSEINLSRDKTPTGVYEVAEFMKSQPQGVVLASLNPGAYLHNHTPKHEMLAPRSLSLRVHYGRDSTEFKFKLSLLSLTSGKKVLLFPTSRYHAVIKRYKVDYLIYRTNNIYMQSYANEFNAEEIYKSTMYIIVKTSF